MSNLPIEIVREVLCTVVRLSVCDERAAAVSTARTSRAIYELVSPDLYRTVVIHDENAALLAELAETTPSSPIFSLIRKAPPPRSCLDAPARPARPPHRRGRLHCRARRGPLRAGAPEPGQDEA